MKQEQAKKKEEDKGEFRTRKENKPQGKRRVNEQEIKN